MDVASLVPLEGGWSGETFVAESLGERVVVRVYGGRSAARGPEAPEVDAAVIALVRGLVPVPEVLEVRRGDPASDTPGLLVTAFLPGERGDVLLPTLGEEPRARLGARLGEVAADLAGMPVPRPGPFLDGDLTIGSFGPDGLPEVVDRQAARLTGWDRGELAGLRAVAETAQALLDGTGRFSLVHSDLNPKNVLVDPATLTVTGLVDWEFAHAGHPATDLGNLLRFERDPAYADAVLGAWAERRRADPAEALALARAADLWALLDLAVRRDESPVATRAHDLLRRISRTGDPGAD